MLGVSLHPHFLFRSRVPVHYSSILRRELCCRSAVAEDLRTLFLFTGRTFRTFQQASTTRHATQNNGLLGLDSPLR